MLEFFTVQLWRKRNNYFQVKILHFGNIKCKVTIMGTPVEEFDIQLALFNQKLLTKFYDAMKLHTVFNLLFLLQFELIISSKRPQRVILAG